MKWIMHGASVVPEEWLENGDTKGRFTPKAKLERGADAVGAWFDELTGDRRKSVGECLRAAVMDMDVNGSSYNWKTVLLLVGFGVVFVPMVVGAALTSAFIPLAGEISSGPRPCPLRASRLRVVHPCLFCAHAC